MTWTGERVATLEQLWTGGLSASAIAAQLGEVTRNAVIGKAHRLGLAGRASRGRPRHRQRAASLLPGRNSSQKPRRSENLPSRSRARKKLLPELGQAPAQPVTVETLGPDSCRWPEGDPKLPGFHFCGRLQTAGPVPYCAHHALRASS
jgi:GcrA cell cycle regulator